MSKMCQKWAEKFGEPFHGPEKWPIWNDANKNDQFHNCDIINIPLAKWQVDKLYIYIFGVVSCIRVHSNGKLRATNMSRYRGLGGLSFEPKVRP